MHKKYQGDDKDHCTVCGDKTSNNCLASGVYLFTIKFVVLIGSRWVSDSGRSTFLPGVRRALHRFRFHILVPNLKNRKSKLQNLFWYLGIVTLAFLRQRISFLKTNTNEKLIFYPIVFHSVKTKMNIFSWMKKHDPHQNNVDRTSSS